MKNLKDRTKQFAVRVAKLCDTLPAKPSFRAYINQLVRCSSSVGANYRASLRSKSSKDFIYKLQIVLEEADESLFFLELIRELGIDDGEIQFLIKEANELVAIFVSSIKTAKNNLK